MLRHYDGRVDAGVVVLARVLIVDVVTWVGFTRGAGVRTAFDGVAVAFVRRDPRVAQKRRGQNTGEDSEYEDGSLHDLARSNDCNPLGVVRQSLI